MISDAFNRDAPDLVPGVIVGSMCTDSALLQQAQTVLNLGLGTQASQVVVGKMHLVVSGSLAHQVTFLTQQLCF